MEDRLVDLYSRLLAWLPQGFRDEFAEEMAQVLSSRVREAGLCGSRAMLCTFVGELLALPGLWLLAYQRERRVFIVNKSAADAVPNGRAFWGAALAAALPLVGFIGVLLMTGTVRRLLGAVDLDIRDGFLFCDIGQR